MISAASSSSVWVLMTSSFRTADQERPAAGLTSILSPAGRFGQAIVSEADSELIAMASAEPLRTHSPEPLIVLLAGRVAEERVCRERRAAVVTPARAGQALVLPEGERAIKVNLL